MTPGFEAFWKCWPANRNGYTRKGGKAECLKRWKARHHETQAETICAHVKWLSTTSDWLKDGGAYIPAPLVYLNQQRWDGAEIPPIAGSNGSVDTDSVYQSQLEASIRAFNAMCGK